MAPEQRKYQREWKRKWRAENPGRNAEVQLAWRNANLERARELDNQRYARDREKRKAESRARNATLRSSPERWLATNILAANSRAKRLGLPCGVTVDDVSLPTHCPITGSLIKYGCSRADKDGPSLDRAIPARGYVAGNVFVISYYANALKRDCIDPVVFERLASYCRFVGESNGRQDSE